MKSLLILTALLTISTSAFAKVSPEFKALAEIKLECNVMSATEINNGKLIKKLDKENTVMTSLTQDGGAEFEDAKCFLTPAVLVETGEKVTIGGGCFSLEKKNIVQFKDGIIELKEKTLKQHVLINLKTGEGSISTSYKGCDWGRDCTSLTSEVRLNGCYVK